MNENVYINKNKNAEEYGHTFEKIKDWYVRGMQLSKVYIDDWNEIKSIFIKMGLKLGEHGPIITMNELKNVRMAKEITENIGGSDPKKVFLTILTVLPTYCRLKAQEDFKQWVKKEDSNFHKLLDLGGTMKSNDKEIEKIISDVLFLGKK